MNDDDSRFMAELLAATRMLVAPVEIMAVMSRMLGEHLRASRCAYADVDEDGNQFTILDDYTDGCATTVGNYHLSLFGPRAVATLRSGQTLIVRSVAELVPDERADMFEAIGIKAIITCPLVKDGRLRAMMAVQQTTPRDWSSGEVAVVQEVVERCWATIERGYAEAALRQSTAQLVESEARFRQMAEAINEVFFLCDLQITEMFYVSPAYEDIFGRSCESLYASPRSFGEAMHPDDRERAFAAIAPEGTVVPFDVEYRILRPDGSERLIRARGFPIYNAAGAIYRFAGIAEDITERKRAAEEVRASEERFQALGQNSWDAVHLLSAEGVILYESPSVIRVLGYQPEELVGRQSFELIHPDDAALAGERFAPVAATPGLTNTVEVRVRHKDGSWPWMDCIATNLLDHPAVRAIAVNYRDITERKRAAEEILLSRQHLRDLLDGLGPAMFVALLTPQGILIDINQSALTAVGLTATDVLGKPFESIPFWAQSPDLQRQLREAITRAAGGEASRYDVRTRGGDDEIIDIDFSLHPLRDQAGQVKFLVPSAIVITERKRAEEAQAQREAELLESQRIARIGSWEWTPATGAVKWSEGMNHVLGRAHGLVAPGFEAIPQFYTPDSWQRLEAAMARAVETGESYDLELEMLGADGGVRWTITRGEVTRGPDGTVVQLHGTVHDITQHHTLEAQFQQAQKMDAIGRLAGGVAHDFNNLLTVMLGFCEVLLADFDVHDPRHADIAEIQKAGLSAAGLTRQLLAFSRKEIIEPTLLDLSTIVTDIRPMLRRLIREDVRILLGLLPDPALVKADRGQVEQVILNLAVNAQDAMATGGTLTIETAEVDLDEHYVHTHFGVTPGPYVVLTVTDTGTGMTPEVQARLFEPFFTTKEVGKGTGLGLATVHGIVTRGGGSVNVYSEVGRGTSFKVYFPQASGAQTVMDTRSPDLRARTGTETVLVVEDADGLRELAKRLLERQGYVVLVAANAEEALQLFEQHPSIDVLLTDVVMPGASGSELSQQLVERRPELRVVYMSGYTEDAIVQHGVLKPGIAFLHKPFTADGLGRKLREVLDRQPAPRTNTT